MPSSKRAGYVKLLCLALAQLRGKDGLLGGFVGLELCQCLLVLAAGDHLTVTAVTWPPCAGTHLHDTGPLRQY